MGIYADELAAIRVAKAAVRDGVQSTSYKGRSVTMVDYAKLCEDEKFYMGLAAQEAAAASGRSRVYYAVPL